MKFSSNGMFRSLHEHSIKVGDLETAAELKRSREYGKCINVLKSIEHFGDEEDKLIASYELGIIYSQLGLHKHADKSLSKVGFTFKLSPSVLCPDLSQSSNKCSSVQNKVAVFDEVLPASLLSSLRSAFAENSPFWTEHGYPTTQFFSYNVLLDNTCKTEPQHTNHLMKELVSVIRPLVAMSFPEKRIEEAESMEWWCHIRSDSSVAAHQLHFDLDEIALANKLHSDFEDEDGESIHPLVSSVLYLNECCANLAPTLLTNQTLDENSVASEAWLCQPAENRLLLFDGDFLHGVVPYLSLDEQAAPSAPRITLMIGWWGPGVHKSKPSAAKTGLGPNMSMPAETTGGGSSSGYSVSNWHIPGKTKSTTAIAPPAKYHCPYLHTDVTWPALLKTEPRQPEISSAVERPVLHVVDGPVWVPVRRAPTVTALRRRHSKHPRASACGKERIKKKSKRCSDLQSQSNNIGNSGSGISGTSSEAIEYMSIAELNALRSAASVDRKSKTQPKRKVNVDADAQEYMSISELNKLRGSQHCSIVAKQKKDKKLRADVLEASSSDAVEYMTMEMLAQLRGGGAVTASIPVSGQAKESHSASLKSFPPHQLSSTGNRLVERRERRLERRAAAKESVLFFGRWFLQSQDEIYRDIVDGVANNTHNH